MVAAGQFASALWQGLLALLYPEGISCICCGDAIDPQMPYSLCGSCVREIHWNLEEAGPIPGKESEWPHLFHRAISCAPYESRTKAMMHRFKYGSQPQLCRSLGSLMLARIETLDVCPDLVIPVPMYQKKEKVRGYNQAALLAQVVADGLQVPWTDRLLLRSRPTEAMSALSEENRRGNLQGAFCMASLPESQLILGKKILLIDDILTTGTTADQCSRVLLEAGAASVELLVFASGHGG